MVPIKIIGLSLLISRVQIFFTKSENEIRNPTKHITNHSLCSQNV